MSQTHQPESSQRSAGFNPNEGVEAGENRALFPSIPGNVAATDLEGYATYFERVLGRGNENPILEAAKSLGASEARYESIKAISATAVSADVVKALRVSPSAFAFGRMSYMPDSAINGGVVQWPGISPESLKKIARENVAPQLIIGMRVDDVIRYSQWSDQIWRPGWRIEMMDPDEEIKENHKKEIQEAVRFLHNSNIETPYTAARKRDEHRLTNFQRFLAAMTRDSLTYDMIAVWTDMDNSDKVKAYALLPGGNIRFCTAEGYNGNPKNFAVAVDDGGRVVQAFTRDELTCYVRNVRTDPDSWGYGWPEIEIGMRVIKGFQNALDLNIDIFDRSAIANGILTISGGAVTQRQLDLLNRLITNMKKGITKAWALPVIGLQGDSKLEIIDLTKIKGNEAYYKEFMNMLAGALATLWRFPVRRLGYKISGGHKDNEPAPDGSTTLVDEDDPGLAPLLQHIETIINEYLLWTRWPHLRFRFTGKNPKEDSREYEARSLARTWGERRKEAGLPPLEKLVKVSGKLKKLLDAAKKKPKPGADAEDGEKPNESSDSKDPTAKADYKVKVKFKNPDGSDKDDGKKPGEGGDDAAAAAEEDAQDPSEEFEANLLKMVTLMEFAPMDPNLSSIFGMLAGTLMKGEGSDSTSGEGGKGNPFTSKLDPARSENHGHLSGVRRDSAKEKGK
jgi:hypothetical protein